MAVRLIDFMSYLIQLYVYVVIASAILSWLLTFGVVNYNNPFVRSLTQTLHAVTEPALAFFRRLTPNLGALDISPILLILFCFFMQSVVLGSLRDALL